MKTFAQISKEYSDELNQGAYKMLDTESLRELGAVSCEVPLWLRRQIDWTDVVRWSDAQYGEWGWICYGNQFWTKTPQDTALFLLRWGDHGTHYE